MIDRFDFSDQDKYLFALVISAISLLLVSPISWNYFDLHLFMLEWNNQLSQSWDIYEVGNSNYPPLVTYLFIFLETVARRTATNPLITETRLTEINWVRIVTRIPLLLAYLWTGQLLYRQWSWKVARYWLFTPPVMLAALLVHVHPVFTTLTVFSWTSLIPLHVCFGYQFDLLAVPFTLLALFSLQNEQPRRFGFYLAIGFLIKFYPVILLPLGLIRFGWRRQLTATVVFGGFVGVTFAPFLLNAPHEFYYQLFGFQSGRFPQGLSIFHIPLLAAQYDIAKFPVILKWLWQALWLPLYGFITLIAIWKAKDEDIVVAFGAVLLSFVMLNKIGNLNYMVWFWPFLLVMVVENHLSLRYVTALIITTTTYPVMIYLPAAIANKPIFIVQELAWYDARTLVLNSFQGISYNSMEQIIYTLNDIFGSQAVFIYQHRFSLLSILIVVHATLQLRLLIGLVNRLGGVYKLAQVGEELRSKPMSVLADVFSDSRSE